MSGTEVVVPLPNDDGAPRVARRRVSELVGDHERVDDLLLCVSEVVTNAVVHARSLVALTYTCEDDVVRIEVVDGSPAALPTRAEPQPSSPSGRGVKIVDALADRWGVEVGGARKTVWFEFDLTP